MSLRLLRCAPTARKTASNRPLAFSAVEIRHFVIQDDLDADSADALDLAVEHLARQAVLRNAEVHHAARHRPGVADDHRVAAAGEVPGSGEAARSGADDQHALTRGGSSGATVQPFASAMSPRKRSTAWMLTALSTSLRLHASSHG